jgi:hypothetical protein
VGQQVFFHDAAHLGENGKSRAKTVEGLDLEFLAEENAVLLADRLAEHEAPQSGDAELPLAAQDQAPIEDLDAKWFERAPFVFALGESLAQPLVFFVDLRFVGFVFFAASSARCSRALRSMFSIVIGSSRPPGPSASSAHATAARNNHVEAASGSQLLQTAWRITTDRNARGPRASDYACAGSVSASRAGSRSSRK